jgi:hypothetical protein
MHSSWWYGIRMETNDIYSIVIIPYYGAFKVITNTLSEFIKLYMDDADVLYDYK